MTSLETHLLKVIENINIRAAFVEGATEGKFGLSRIDAEILALKKYPRPTREDKGELSEIAEANRVPQIAPREGEFTENLSEVEAF